MKHSFLIVGFVVGLFIAPFAIEAREPRAPRAPATPATPFSYQKKHTYLDARGVTARALRGVHRSGEILVKMRGDRYPKLMRGRRGETASELLAQVQSRSDVVYAEPNFIAYAQGTPNDQYFSYQWHLGAGPGGVHAEAAWDVTNGSGVTIAIIDTGVAYENYGGYDRAPDLAGTSFVRGYDFVNNDTHANDDNGHGTHIAGTIAQTTNNQTGLSGLAHGALIMPIKVLDERGAGTYANIIAGIRYAADNGAEVINLSLGGYDHSNALRDAVAYAHGKGVVVVAAAGNDGVGEVMYPGAYNDYVIAVGASRLDETKASYSNYGTALDLVAPGGDRSVDQNNDGYGDGILQQTFSSRINNFGYIFYQGTSMAAPHVSAAAAMVKSAGLAASPNAIRRVLEDNADDLGSRGRDNTYGYGLLNLANIFNGQGATPAPEPEPTSEPEPQPEPEPTPEPEEEEQRDTTTSESAVLFTESFEGNGSGWTQDGQNDWKISRQRATDERLSAEVDGFASDASLLSPVIDVSGRNVIEISFDWLIENRVDSGEYLAFDISFDSGNSWAEYERLRGNVDAENTWHTVSLQLEDLNTTTLQLRFRGKMSRSNEDANVDDIVVVGQ